MILSNYNKTFFTTKFTKGTKNTERQKGFKNAVNPIFIFCFLGELGGSNRLSLRGKP